jgi:hypothetical protein
VEEIIREPIELSDTDLDLVAGGFGSVAAGAGSTGAAAGGTAAALTIAAAADGAAVAIALPFFGSVVAAN